MKLRTPDGRRQRGRAADFMRVPEQEHFSVKNLFDANEWQEVRESVNRSNKNFGYVQDQWFLALAAGELESLSPKQEELLNIGYEWLKEVGRTPEDLHRNIDQYLHCMAFLSNIAPEKRDEFPLKKDAQNYLHTGPDQPFQISRGYPNAIGMRIVLRRAVDYITNFPEDRTWALQELQKRVRPETIEQALHELVQSGNWSEYTTLGAYARLLFPEQLNPNHVIEIAQAFEDQKKSHQGILYTMLPTVVDIRVLAAKEARLTETGQIHIEDQSSLSSNRPLPQRLVA